MVRCHLVHQFSCSVVSDSLQPHELQYARLPCPSPTPRACSNSSIESVMPFNHLILSSPSPPAFNLSQHQGLFSSESALRIRWQKYWHFSFSISSSNACSGLISFTIDWFDLLAVQGTLKSLLWHRNSKASILPVLSLLHLTSIHDYWKNHSFDSTDLYWQSDVSAF